MVFVLFATTFTGIFPASAAPPKAGGWHDCSDGSCSFFAGTPCGHTHDENCGYIGTAPCGHVHDGTCEEGCEHIHGEECGFIEGLPCSHVHDADCGYSETVDCDYAPDADGAPSAIAAAVAVTVKLANTTSAISKVELFRQNLEGKKVLPPDDLYDISTAFEAYDVVGNTFKVRLAELSEINPAEWPVPGVKRSLSVRITLLNGTVLESWDSAGKDKPLSITPAQTKSGATQSKKSVTLYKSAPHLGETITLSLSDPANVKIANTGIDKKSIDALKFVNKYGKNEFGEPLDLPGGLELVRDSQNSWLLRFEDGILPTAANPKKGMKSSYTVKLELWADGTCILVSEPNKNKTVPVALSLGKTASKPTIIKIKVNIK